MDWNNHNDQWRIVNGQRIPIHVGGVVYGDVSYTQPFLNNMHITAPTLYYLETLARKIQDRQALRFLDCEENGLTTVPRS